MRVIGVYAVLYAGCVLHATGTYVECDVWLVEYVVGV